MYSVYAAALASSEAYATQLIAKIIVFYILSKCDG